MRLAYAICFQKGPWPLSSAELPLIRLSASILQFMDEFENKDDEALKLVRSQYTPEFLSRRCIQLVKDEALHKDVEFFDPAPSIAISMRTSPDVWKILIREKLHVVLVGRIWKEARWNWGQSIAKRVVEILR